MKRGTEREARRDKERREKGIETERGAKIRYGERKKRGKTIGKERD